MPAPTAAPTLTDGVVTLRSHRAADLPRMVEQCRDPEMQEWTQVPVPYKEADAEQFVGELVPQWWADGTECVFAVDVGGAFSGSVSLRDEGNGRFEVAFGAHPDVRGTGAMERAVRLLLEWGFTEQGAETIVWRAFVGNWASRRLAWRLGFRMEGTLRRYLPHRGALRDAWVGTLRKDDERRPTSTWLDNPVVEGDGVRLRPFDQYDVGRVVEGVGDEQTQYWLAFLPRDPGEAEGRLPGAGDRAAGDRAHDHVGGQRHRRRPAARGRRDPSDPRGARARLLDPPGCSRPGCDDEGGAARGRPCLR